MEDIKVEKSSSVERLSETKTVKVERYKISSPRSNSKKAVIFAKELAGTTGYKYAEVMYPQDKIVIILEKQTLGKSKYVQVDRTPIKCCVCGKEIVNPRTKQSTCGGKCSQKAYNAKKLKPSFFKCVTCGKEFYRGGERSITCSVECKKMRKQTQDSVRYEKKHRVLPPTTQQDRDLVSVIKNQNTGRYTLLVELGAGDPVAGLIIFRDDINKFKEIILDYYYYCDEYGYMKEFEKIRLDTMMESSLQQLLNCVLVTDRTVKWQKYHILKKISEKLKERFGEIEGRCDDTTNTNL